MDALYDRFELGNTWFGCEWCPPNTRLAPLVTFLDPKEASLCIAFPPSSTDCIQNPPKCSLLGMSIMCTPLSWSTSHFHSFTLFPSHMLLCDDDFLILNIVLALQFDVWFCVSMLWTIAFLTASSKKFQLLRASKYTCGRTEKKAYHCHAAIPCKFSTPLTLHHLRRDNFYDILWPFFCFSGLSLMSWILPLRPTDKRMFSFFFTFY